MATATKKEEPNLFTIHIETINLPGFGGYKATFCLADGTILETFYDFVGEGIVVNRVQYTFFGPPYRADTVSGATMNRIYPKFFPELIAHMQAFNYPETCYGQTQ